MAVMGTSVQVSQQGRRVIEVAVDRGRVFTASAEDTAWVEATNLTGNTPPLSYTGIVRSTVLNQLMFFFDGVNLCYYEPSTDTVKTWVASSGTIPRGSDNGAFRLGCTWRGRLVGSGLFADPENLFCSGVTEPTTWNFFPPVTTATQAVALNTAPQGIVGDPIYCVAAYSNDLLVVGGSQTLKVISGDLMANGQVDLISSKVGMAWGEPYCMDTKGNFYFVSSDAKVYAWRPGMQPEIISNPVAQILKRVDMGKTGVRVGFDPSGQAIHVFLTTLEQPNADDVHLTMELRSGTWTTLKFKNKNHNPLALCNYDGNREQDRALHIGSWDGYSRYFDITAADDDGSVIESDVVIGPLTSQDFAELMLEQLIADLAEDSGTVKFNVYKGPTAEKALSSTALAPVDRTWKAGRNNASPVHRAGHAIYIRITSTNRWALERIRAEVTKTGDTRARQKGA
jgi:hypothetical protein